MPNLKITPNLITRLTAALAEDIGSGDITTNLVIPAGIKLEVFIIAKEPCIASGLSLLPHIFKLLDKRLKVQLLKKEGSVVKRGQKVVKISGPAHSILTGERLALNFISKLSGIATLTRQYVEKVKPYRTEILATRKTTPLMRDLEKYAVLCGGGLSHRWGLYDEYMLKDNHKLILNSLNQKEKEAIFWNIKKQRKKNVLFEVEVDSLRELEWALSLVPEVILLDNFSPKKLKEAVRLNGKLSKKLKVKKPLLEASGGITLKNVKQVARIGVDRISIGALTHSAKAVDFSLEVR